ncbi:MAG: hypothetical protein ABIS86_05000 [Streptosporangiaceae bacterium]
MRIADAVSEAVLELTCGTDTLAAANRYYSQEFIQHSPIFPAGWDGLIASIDHAKGLGASYEVLRAIGDGDLAVLHARVTGFAEHPLIMFNVYRVADSKIIEHWEGLQPEFDPALAGGTTEVSELDRTDGNRALVRDLIEKSCADGAPGAAGDPDLNYVQLHQLVAEGNFVYAQCAGEKEGQQYAVHELFRLQDGEVVEGWNVVTPIPEQLPHDNGVF